MLENFLTEDEPKQTAKGEYPLSKLAANEWKSFAMYTVESRAIPNMIDGLKFLGIQAKALNFDETIEEALEAFEPTIFLTSDHYNYLSRINWQAIKEYRKTHKLYVGLTVDCSEFASTDSLLFCSLFSLQSLVVIFSLTDSVC